MNFINDNFMLQTKTAQYLYENFAKDLPIIDYHCHLSPAMIADNVKFKNATELFLGGDHYKWRVMRSNGIDEEYITGSADDFEKFYAFAKSLKYCIGNPMFHWTHLELKRYFGIDEILNEDSAKRIYDSVNEQLAGDDFTTQALIKKSNVEVICTTDDPVDSLEHHIRLKNDGFATKVIPTFRPDKAVHIELDTFIPYVKQLGASTYKELLCKLDEKIAFFNDNGCRLSDHAMEYVPFAKGDAEKIFEKRMKGEAITKEETDIFSTQLLKHCAEKYTEYGWVMQLHIGALRNNNARMFEKLGPDTGFDSIADSSIAAPLSKLLDYMNSEDTLPKTVLYTLNPKDNYVLGTMLGNFQSAPVAGKIQFGSGWWFNDQRDGMVEQMKALANLGLLGRFIGMLTDSRSFVSYPRHEYFRRILCNLIGKWVEDGEYPADDKALKEIINGICYFNVKKYIL